MLGFNKSSSHNPILLKLNQRHSWISILCYFCQIPFQNFLNKNLPNFACYVNLQVSMLPSNLFTKFKTLSDHCDLWAAIMLACCYFFSLQNYFSRDKGIWLSLEGQGAYCFVQSFEALLHIWTRLSSHLVHTALCKQI